ncbi:purine-binding chemotaxis protein CheW [Cytobacillus depressus]|uniref:Purine-binding chemotaxis protein CheW n=1 Tax=Cytobacillus depressus TaxID=1602942 RepID=A0A6L3VCN2_9BACI|nr:chemotaxis protein CheW [Cytobacillus depressus]KAB2338433.1 purine-binding chemotaxis protein CheW [Cytobacillus depressus]
MVETSKVVVFQVGNEEYAIPIRFVISIEKVEGITPIPHLPDYMNGIFKVRGELIPVIDFERVLYQRPSNINELTKIIVIHTNELSLGVIVKDAKEIIDIPPEKIKQLGLIAYGKTSYFTGVANLDSRIITLIDPLKMVQSLDGIKQIQDFMAAEVNT